MVTAFCCDAEQKKRDDASDASTSTGGARSEASEASEAEKHRCYAKVSTAEYRHWAKTARATKRTRNRLRAVSARLPEDARAALLAGLPARERERLAPSRRHPSHVSRGAAQAARAALLETYQRTALPCASDAWCWRAYCSALLPALPHLLLAHGSKNARATRLLSASARDAALDRVCHRVLGLGRIGGGQQGKPPPPTRRERRRRRKEQLESNTTTTTTTRETVVAFGDGQACATGFGHAPAPQAGLRHRLGAVHKARVILVPECNTSQICCCCDAPLVLVHSATAHRRRERRGKEKWQRRGGGGDGAEEEEDYGRSEAGNFWSVKRCPNCCLVVATSTAAAAAPLSKYWHRDKNGAGNILRAYAAAAAGLPRPVALQQRQRQRPPPAIAPAAEAEEQQQAADDRSEDNDGDGDDDGDDDGDAAAAEATTVSQ
jgi:hypothetical protein